MSTPTCPFCQAAEDPEWQYGNVVWFNCGTMVSLDKPKRAHQTRTCVEAEVAGLTTQRDQLLQKVQRLEEAGNAMHPWCEDIDAAEAWKTLMETKP